jgi:transcriptional regulator with XRE-family HTH domain
MSKSQDLTPAQRATLQRIGIKLKETREQQGRSIESVAAEAGIAIELLYAIEAGREEVILESLAWISAFYGTSQDDVWRK